MTSAGTASPHFSQSIFEWEFTDRDEIVDALELIEITRQLVIPKHLLNRQQHKQTYGWAPRRHWSRQYHSSSEVRCDRVPSEALSFASRQYSMLNFLRSICKQDLESAMHLRDSSSFSHLILTRIARVEKQLFKCHFQAQTLYSTPLLYYLEK